MRVQKTQKIMRRTHEVGHQRGYVSSLEESLRRDELPGGKAPQGALKKENARLKKLLAEKELDIDILKEVSQGNF
jgi:hypothetical protein